MIISASRELCVRGCLYILYDYFSIPGSCASEGVYIYYMIISASRELCVRGCIYYVIIAASRELCVRGRLYILYDYFSIPGVVRQSKGVYIM